MKLSKEEYKRNIDENFASLDRVGKEVFGGWEVSIAPLVWFDLSVLKNKKVEGKIK